MDWEAPAFVLSARPYGETSAIVRLLSEEQGVTAGLVRGGVSRRQVAVWQPGNLVLARWRARLPDQLGHVTAELVQSAASRLLDHPLSLALLASVTALADGALPEHEPHPDLFISLVRLVTAIGVMPDDPPMAMAIRWERDLLAALGYGLRLESCAVTGATDGLAYVSPRTGRAVSDDAAGEWRDKLLPMPALLRDDADPGHGDDWVKGFDLTGYFLARHVYGVRHVPLPDARERLVQRLRLRSISPPVGDADDQ
ncbi:DNA repair protein RecO [Neoasaia chiangmaiensis NBRC 101099]|uniref:DNA repair protein RecO n=1 Tax=Neoasaia chiangmaiensis TaxID=320497 RepID=A0A1U9KMT5_9PROT|nr:DNA repair protein RecO [Neoasaia chiangmaiensis]AQS87103.1 DNA repair protein RecO [Neoasaia chiangmaiensis]GBR38076.1 DNA repair protein RecO [Neoasaia chiangmaiensis NBRC 101099]GEN16065.1 DNA repair protein RecO [Neoasaia chiangmaiensis]